MPGRSRKKTPAPKGPDFSEVDTREKAETLCRRGELEKLLLLPPEYGGEDHPDNVVYVPVGIAAAKADIDDNIIGSLLEEGKVTRYRATPEYLGRSIIPAAIKVAAFDPGRIDCELLIWGEALNRETPAVDAGFQSLLDLSMAELQAKQAAHDAGWGLGVARWDLDQDTGILTFSGKTMVATAPAQIIGTYNTVDSSWLWAWDHPSVEPNMAEHAHRIRAYGQQHDLGVLTTRKLSCTEQEAWEFTALACHLCEAQGAYRGPAGTALVFLTFGEVAVKPKGRRR